MCFWNENEGQREGVAKKEKETMGVGEEMEGSFEKSTFHGSKNVFQNSSNQVLLKGFILQSSLIAHL